MAGSLFIIILVKWCYERYTRCKIWGFFCIVGNNTLQIYVLQRLLLETVFAVAYTKMVSEIGYNILDYNIVLYNMIWTLLIAICFLELILFMVKKIKKIWIVSTILFGR